MTGPLLVLAANETGTLVACPYGERRLTVARLQPGDHRDSRLLAAIARVIPSARLRTLRGIVVAVKLQSFSQTRATIATANTLSAAIGCPVVQVPVGAGRLDPEPLIARGRQALARRTPRWATPAYQGVPNISKPAERVAQYHVTAGGIVYDKSRDAFLFVQRQDSKRIGLPKGHQEKGETLVETALREIAEETGITNLTFLAALTPVTFRFRESGKLHEKKQYNYLFLRGSAKTTARLTTKEVRNLRNCWLVPERALRNPHLYPDLYPVIHRAMDILQRRGLRKPR